MHPGVYTRVGAYTRTVGVYTQGVCIRTPSRIHRFLRIRTPDCVYAGIDEPYDERRLPILRGEVKNPKKTFCKLDVLIQSLNARPFHKNEERF